MHDVRVRGERVDQVGEHFREHVGADDQHRVGVTDRCPADRRRTCGRVRPRRADGWRACRHVGRVRRARRPHRVSPRPGPARFPPRRWRHRRRPAQMGRSAPDQQGRRLGDQVGGRQRPGPQMRCRHDQLVVELVQHVHRQGHEDRSARRGHRDLDRAAEHPQQRPRVDHPGCPLGHRPGHRHQVGRHLRVHRVVARCRTRRRPPAAARAHAWPGTACRCRCRARRRCAAAARRGRRSPGRIRRPCPPRPSPAGSGSSRKSGKDSRASRNPCSTVPGLPNMCVMPSARNCSIMASLPVLRHVLSSATSRYRRRPCSRTSTIFSPVRKESGVERPVMKG